MSELPMKALGEEKQDLLMSRMFGLLGKQVQSYHRHRHMGQNSSVPVELAQELMASMEYTLRLAGGIPDDLELEAALKSGQEILVTRVEKARALLELVACTAPRWQTECRWDAIHCLREYLAQYDHRHLAHRTPTALYYPMPVPVPDGLRGIDHCLFYLNVMRNENRIMDGADREPLWEVLSRRAFDAENQCEQLLINGIGKALIHSEWEGIMLEPRELEQIASVLAEKPSREVRAVLEPAVVRLCRWLDISEPDFADYVRFTAAQLLPRLEAAVLRENLRAVFLCARSISPRAN